MEDEERCLPNENFLDLQVKEGYIEKRWVEALQRAKGLVHSLTSQEFTTIIAVDFYDHDSKATQPGYGFNPNYNSTFSFKNQMDHFYV